MKRALGGAIGVAALIAALGANARASRAVPAQFYPESVAATSTQDLWLLGIYSCSTGWCNALVRTRDGGRSFERLRPPSLPGNGGAPELRFADSRNGYLFADKLFYATHDGGATWRRVRLGSVFSLATADGEAYVVTTRGIATSAVMGDRWRSRLLSFATVAIAARGKHVWVLGTDGKRGRLAWSSDGGRTFATGSGPCLADFAGRLLPESSAVVWAVCPAGSTASVEKSVDGGKSFARIKTPYELSSFVTVAPATASTAVLAPGTSSRPFLRTTDGGARWTRVRTPAAAGSVFSIGFVDPRDGFALVQLEVKQELWRTTDAGESWQRVPIR